MKSCRLEGRVLKIKRSLLTTISFPMSRIEWFQGSRIRRKEWRGECYVLTVYGVTLVWFVFISVEGTGWSEVVAKILLGNSKKKKKEGRLRNSYLCCRYRYYLLS